MPGIESGNRSTRQYHNGTLVKPSKWDAIRRDPKAFAVLIAVLFATFALGFVIGYSFSAIAMFIDIVLSHLIPYRPF